MKKKQRTLTRTVLEKISQWPKNITAKKKKSRKEDKNDNNNIKKGQDRKNKKQIPRGGVTRPPSQFESYSLSASSKSYSGRSYSAPKPD